MKERGILVQIESKVRVIDALPIGGFEDVRSEGIIGNGWAS